MGFCQVVWRLLVFFFPVIGVVVAVGFSALSLAQQTVQRAELWGVTLGFQADAAVHIGGDSLNVVRNVTRLLAEYDGDLLAYMEVHLDPHGEYYSS